MCFGFSLIMCCDEHMPYPFRWRDARGGEKGEGGWRGVRREYDLGGAYVYLKGKEAGFV